MICNSYRIYNTYRLQSKFIFSVCLCFYLHDNAMVNTVKMKSISQTHMRKQAELHVPKLLEKHMDFGSIPRQDHTKQPFSFSGDV